MNLDLRDADKLIVRNLILGHCQLDDLNKQHDRPCDKNPLQDTMRDTGGFLPARVDIQRFVQQPDGDEKCGKANDGRYKHHHDYGLSIKDGVQPVDDIILGVA